jgi:hypothetical protein
MCAAGYRPEWSPNPSVTPMGVRSSSSATDTLSSESYAAAPSLDALVAER